MTAIDITSVIGLMVLGIALFFLVYLSFNYKKQLSEKLLFFLFVVLSLNLGYSILIDTKLIEHFPMVYVLFNKGHLLYLLIYPLLFAFIQVYTRNHFQKALFLVLMTPPIILLVLSLIRFVSFDTELIHQQVNLFLMDNRPGPEQVFRSPFLFSISVLIPGLVIFLIYKELRLFLNQAIFSNTKNLLIIFSLLAVLIFVLRLSSYPLQFYFYQKLDISFIEWKIEILFTSLFILILSISTLLHFKLEELGDIVLQGRKKKVSAITEDDLINLLEQIKITIIEKEFFQNHGLSLDDLSRELNVNTKYLSMALNQVLGKSFPEFINECRLDKAKELILSDTFEQYSIEAIAFESGFNSRATFYRVFKSEMGLSPSEYRKNNISS